MSKYRHFVCSECRKQDTVNPRILVKDYSKDCKVTCEDDPMPNLCIVDGAYDAIWVDQAEV